MQVVIQAANSKKKKKKKETSEVQIIATVCCTSGSLLSVVADVKATVSSARGYVFQRRFHITGPRIFLVISVTGPSTPLPTADCHNAFKLFPSTKPAHLSKCVSL